MTVCDVCGLEHDFYRDRDVAVKVYATTIPKSGTNLLRQILDEPAWVHHTSEMHYGGIPIQSQKQEHLSMSENEIYSALHHAGPVAYGHTIFDKEFALALKERGIVTIFLYRDPRDIAVSHSYHVHRYPEAGMNHLDESGNVLSDYDDPLLKIIETIKPWLMKFQPWLEWQPSPDMQYMIPLRFEDLVAQPILSVTRIRAAIAGLHGKDMLAEVGLARIQDAMNRIDPDESPTFRKGVAGEWRSEFEPHHLDAWHEHAEGLVESFGYTWE